MPTLAEDMEVLIVVGQVEIVHIKLERLTNAQPRLGEQPKEQLITRMVTGDDLQHRINLAPRDPARPWLRHLHAVELDQRRRPGGPLWSLCHRPLRERLDSWLTRTEESGLAPLVSFANGIRRDYAAVKAGLTLEWSNGPTEGHVNRLKQVKRQMYGRANLDLLKLRLIA
jgi:hypothetical protein